MTSHDTPSGSAKPSIIDLEAETISDDSSTADTAPIPPAPPEPPKHRRANRWLWPALAIGIAAVAGGWIYKDLLSGYVPSDAMKQATARIETLEAQTKTLNDQLTALANQSEQLKGTLTASQTAAETAGATARDMAGKATDLENRIAAVENTAQTIKTDMAKLAVPPAPATASSTTVDSGALAALAKRVDTVEKDVASLKAPRSTDDTAALTSALSQSLSDLKAKIASGTSYQAEYDRIARMVPAAAGLDILKSRAAEGLPNAQGLATELLSQVELLPKPAAPAEPDDGYLASFWNAIGSVVTVKNIGDADLPAVARQAATLAESGDLTRAIALIDGIEGEKPNILTQWRGRAEARLQLDQALEHTSASVLQQISSMGSAQ